MPPTNLRRLSENRLAKKAFITKISLKLVFTIIIWWLTPGVSNRTFGNRTQSNTNCLIDYKGITLQHPWDVLRFVKFMALANRNYKKINTQTRLIADVRKY